MKKNLGWSLRGTDGCIIDRKGKRERRKVRLNQSLNFLTSSDLCLWARIIRRSKNCVSHHKNSKPRPSFKWQESVWKGKAKVGVQEDCIHRYFCYSAFTFYLSNFNLSEPRNRAWNPSPLFAHRQEWKPGKKQKKTNKKLGWEKMPYSAMLPFSGCLWNAQIFPSSHPLQPQIWWCCITVTALTLKSVINLAKYSTVCDNVSEREEGRKERGESLGDWRTELVAKAWRPFFKCVWLWILKVCLIFLASDLDKL